ncbi:unnamed protein product [Lupinus luteus]|uniref:Nodule Cysteine-Rich (NCR) secreted peptide n=1 Tax=Lupinus luteus TaxID=3873 RepID=A0AAV1YID8_LUPLU
MEKSSFKLFFLVVLLIIAVCHGVPCQRDVDCINHPEICNGKTPRFLLCNKNGQCDCVGANEKQQLNSQENASLH